MDDVDVDETIAGLRVLITGAGRGLGRAYALELARRGARIVANDVDQEPLAEVAQADTSGRIVTIAASVAAEPEVERLFAEAAGALGGLDVVVSNAGVYHRASWADESEVSIRRSVDVNLVGSMLVGSYALRHFHEAGRGRLVLTTSNSYLGTPGISTYAATKGAVVSLAYSWANELVGTEVEVSAFAPRAYTRMSSSALLAEAERCPPERIAHALVGLLSTPHGALHGRVISCDGSTIGVNSRPEVVSIGRLTHLDTVARAVRQAVQNTEE